MNRARAEALARRGFNIFPIAAGAKFPPLWSDWPGKAAAQVPPDWPEHANIGIHCAGLLVVDIDPRNGGEETVLGYELSDTPLPPTLEAITPSGGRHLFYRLPAGHPGVPNRAHALGRGMDVKSARGYVVGAGSVTPAGEYRFMDDTPIHDAPEWLIALCGAQKTANESKGVPVAEAPPDAVERALTWLRGHDPAIEGCGGDQHTYKTACFLRDLGLSPHQTFELMENNWNERCSPPWHPADLSAKVDHAYRYASGEPGGRMVTPEDFPDVAPVQEQPKRVNRPRVTRLDVLAAQDDLGPGDLIAGLLQQSTLSQLYGAPGLGKTFVALDMAYHVAAGKPWMGRKVEQGTALYLAYEGQGGLVKRAKALKHHYQQAAVPLHFVDLPVNLREAAGREEMRSILSDLPEKPKLIVIDTFAQALLGADENSAQDVGAFIHAVQAMIKATGACVLLLHHPGKDPTKGPRGSTALYGASDTIIEVSRGVLTPTKQKDMEVCQPIGFKLMPLMVGMRGDDPVTSCVVVPADVALTPSGRKLTGNNQRGWEALCKLSPDNSPVPESDWKEACREFLGSQRQAARFYDIKNRLSDLIIVQDGFVTRKME